MRQLGTAAIVALLAGVTWPAHAQMQTPNINLLQDAPSKTPEEREADEVREKAYKDSLKKIPEAKASNDPWGAVRSDNAPPKAAAKAVPAKPKAAKTDAKSEATVKQQQQQ